MPLLMELGISTYIVAVTVVGTSPDMKSSLLNTSGFKGYMPVLTNFNTAFAIAAIFCRLC
jgi:hypothetical protein